jgi:hypothetical protein
MTKVPCTCGCGRDVSPSTKQNHLKGHGTTALRARVLAETESQMITDGQRRDRLNNKNRGSKKRPFNPDQGSSSKRLKASHLEVGPEPEIASTGTFRADTNPMDQPEANPEPETFSTLQSRECHGF